jgi:hypothetical protein
MTVRWFGSSLTHIDMILANSNTMLCSGRFLICYCVNFKSTNCLFECVPFSRDSSVCHATHPPEAQVMRFFYRSGKATLPYGSWFRFRRWTGPGVQRCGVAPDATGHATCDKTALRTAHL